MKCNECRYYNETDSVKDEGECRIVHPEMKVAYEGLVGKHSEKTGFPKVNGSSEGCGEAKVTT